MNAGEFLLPGILSTARAGDFEGMNRLLGLLAVEAPRDLEQVRSIKHAASVEIMRGQIELLLTQMGPADAALTWLTGFQHAGDGWSGEERWRIVEAMLDVLFAPPPAEGVK